MNRVSVTIVFVLSCLVLATRPAAAQEVKTLDLGRLPFLDSAAPRDIFPFAINDLGDVAGAVVGLGEPYGTETPFVWTRTTGYRLFFDNTPGLATDINNRGQVVGVISVQTGPRTAESRGFLWDSSNDGYVDLGSFYPTAINDHGHMVGSCHGFACRVIGGHEQIIDLGDVEIGSSGAQDINDAGEIVGSLYSRSEGYRGFVWTEADGVRLLRPPDGLPWSAANHINNQGVVGGQLFTDDEFPTSYPATWTRAGELWADLVRPGSAQDVGANGVVLVNEYDADRLGTTASVRFPDGRRLALASEDRQIWGADIGSNGVIVGYMFHENHHANPIVWTVTPSQRTFPGVGDTFVRAGASSARNFGTATTLRVKKGLTAEYTRRGYLKFDISDISAIGKATLRLHGRVSDARDRRVRAGIFGVSNQSWDEQAVTWSTKPAYGPLLGIVKVRGTAPQWVEIDVTAFVQAEQQAGRGTISVALRALEHTSAYASFDARESGASGPQLIITPP